MVPLTARTRPGSGRAVRGLDDAGAGPAI